MPLRSSAATVLSKLGPLGFRRDRGDLAPVLGQRMIEGRAKMLGRDRAERRRFEFPGPGGEQRVFE